MSEEAIKEVEINLEEVGTEIPGEVAPVEYTAAEQEAMKHGWKPQTEWEGDEDDFISAPEFNRRAELFDKIARQSRDLKQIDAKYNQLIKMQSKIAEKAKEETIKELMEQKTEAYAREDFSKVVELDEKIAEEKNATVLPEAPSNTVDPHFTAWTQENTWYENDADLADLADAFGMAYGQKEIKKGRDPNSITMDEVLAHVDSKMKPHLNVSPARGTKAPAVEGASKSAGKRPAKKAAFTEADLSEDQKVIMNDIIKSDPSFTKEMYIESLVQIGELTK